ncbi:MAG: tetratricopeptide (TPR) repeat protein [Halioglobus sp.]|jgi:tetratricopeptide (TPR) repeat protein
MPFTCQARERHRSRALMTGLTLVISLAAIRVPHALSHPGEHEQVQRITASIDQAPQNQELYIRRGSIYSQGGQFDAAKQDLAQAEKLGEPVFAAYEWGLLYHRMEEFEQAEAYFSLYIKRFSVTAGAYESRAQLRRDARDYPGAVADLQRYFELRGNPHPGNYIAAASMLAEMDKVEEALALLDSGMEKLGMTPQLQRQAITLEQQRGELSLAIKRLETLRLPLKENAGWQLEMAGLLTLDGRPQEAISLLEKLDSDLEDVRATPARQDLQRRANALRSSLEKPSPIL